MGIMNKLENEFFLIRYRFLFIFWTVILVSCASQLRKTDSYNTRLDLYKQKKKRYSCVHLSKLLKTIPLVLEEEGYKQIVIGKADNDIFIRASKIVSFQGSKKSGTDLSDELWEIYFTFQKITDYENDVTMFFKSSPKMSEAESTVVVEGISKKIDDRIFLQIEK